MNFDGEVVIGRTWNDIVHAQVVKEGGVRGGSVVKGAGSRGAWHRDLVVNAEEGLANFTIFLLLVDKFIQGIEVGRGAAIDVVPPVANKVLLIEDGSVGTEEIVHISVRLAHVENLKSTQRFHS